MIPLSITLNLKTSPWADMKDADEYPSIGLIERIGTEEGTYMRI